MTFPVWSCHDLKGLPFKSYSDTNEYCPYVLFVTITNGTKIVPRSVNLILSQRPGREVSDSTEDEFLFK